MKPKTMRYMYLLATKVYSGYKRWMTMPKNITCISMTSEINLISVFFYIFLVFFTL